MSIVQIVEGIKEAQRQTEAKIALTGAIARINPSNLNIGTKSAQEHLFDFDDHVLIQNVEFDVAVTTEGLKSNQGGVGIFIAPLALRAKRQSDSKNIAVSRIKFSVPIIISKESSSKTEKEDSEKRGRGLKGHRKHQGTLSNMSNKRCDPYVMPFIQYSKFLK